MANSDAELVSEVRALTDYDDTIFSDGELLELVNIGKDELRSEWGDEGYQFYDGPLIADRALFWFVVVAAKIRAGEIAGSNINIADIELRNPAHVHHEVLINRFVKKKDRAGRTINQGENAGPAVQSNERTDDRTYGYE
jgi:hypothetical protein